MYILWSIQIFNTHVSLLIHVSVCRLCNESTLERSDCSQIDKSNNKDLCILEKNADVSYLDCKEHIGSFYECLWLDREYKIAL